MNPEDKAFHADAVDHPAHYNAGKIECIEFIEDQRLGFHLGNAVKYIVRAGKKNPGKMAEDLDKAIWYIRRQQEILKANPLRPNAMADKWNEWNAQPWLCPSDANPVPPKRGGS